MSQDRNQLKNTEDILNAEKLIERIKGGEKEAYNELVRCYWQKAYNWAYSYTREPHLAEDIAQESFTKVFLHLDSLHDPKLFFPWLKIIIKNTALTNIRKHSSRSEQPLSTFNDLSNRSNTPYELLINNRYYPSTEDQVMLKDAYNSVRTMLCCLSRRERQVFESCFFHDMSTTDIAAKYEISINNVYSVLSRAKDKIYKQHVYTAIKQYISKIKEHDRLDKIILKKPEPFLFLSWTTISNCIYLLTRYSSKNYSFVEVFGLTSHAFRLNLVGNDINIGGPTSYDWNTTFYEGSSALGLRCKTLFTPAVPNQDVNYQLADSFSKSLEAMEERPIQDGLWEALDLIRDSIRRGIPVVTWDVFIPEFGIIYGYDDHTRNLYVIDHAQSEGAVLPYENLGRGLLKDLFVMTIDETFSIDRLSSLKTALNMILRHVRGDDYNHDPKVVSGIPAYSHWISAFEKREIEPTGNSYNINLISDARKNAHLFLEEVANWTDEIIEPEAKKVAKDASKKYQAVAGYLEVLRNKFPFPQGGTPNDPEIASFTIEHLRLAMRAEEEGIQLLEKLLIIISKRK